MEPVRRSLNQALTVVCGVAAAGIWAFNGVTAVTSGAGPSLEALLVALALTMSGIAVGITANVAIALLHFGRRPRRYPAFDGPWPDPLIFLLLLGVATGPLFYGSLSTLEWVLLAAGALVSGFALGWGSTARLRRSQSAAPEHSSPVGNRY